MELNNVLSASPFGLCVLADFQVRWPFKSSHWSSQSCVGAAADGCAVSWLAVAVRAEVLEGCCYASPSLSLSLSLSLPPSLSLSLACIPPYNPHLGQAGWESIQCSAPLCRLGKEWEKEGKKILPQSRRKRRRKKSGKQRHTEEDLITDIIYIYRNCLYIYIYLYTRISIFIVIYVYIYTCI